MDAEIFDHWDKRAQNMQMRLDTVLHPGQTCSYEYDFGSTTELRIKVIAEREVPASGNLIRMLARNSSPIPCDICGKPAISTCTPYSNDDEVYLCDSCAKHHNACSAREAFIYREFAACWCLWLYREDPAYTF